MNIRREIEHKIMERNKELGDRLDRLIDLFGEKEILNWIWSWIGNNILEEFLEYYEHQLEAGNL